MKFTNETIFEYIKNELDIAIWLLNLPFGVLDWSDPYGIHAARDHVEKIRRVLRKGL